MLWINLQIIAIQGGLEEVIFWKSAFLKSEIHAIPRLLALATMFANGL